MRISCCATARRSSGPRAGSASRSANVSRDLISRRSSPSARHPGLQVCGVYSPPFATLLDLDHEEIFSRIRAAKPDIVLVAIGAPKQEKWIYMHYQKLGLPLCIGIGASLDFVAGKFSRAPVWMQKCGLEWLHRLSQEPRRLFKRYWTDFRFFVSAVRKHRKMLHRAIAPVPALPESARMPGIATHLRAGRADAAAVASGAISEPTPETGRRHVIADLSGVTFIDSGGLGLLLKGFRHCKEAGGALVVLRPSDVVRDLFTLSKLSRPLPCAETEEEAHRLIALGRADTGTTAERDRQNQRVIFHCPGELNAANSADFRETVQAKWEREDDATILEIDFSRERFAAAHSQRQEELVFGGADWHGAEVFHARIAASPLRQRIRNLGFVAKEDLPVWYGGATAMDYPSLFEGFGLPPVEAMACGCPVVSSPRGSLHEMVGDAVRLIEPEDCAGIAAALGEMATSESVRESWRARGLERAASFCWETAATAVMESYRAAAGRSAAMAGHPEGGGFCERHVTHHRAGQRAGAAIVDFNAIVTGKAKDIILEPQDIVWVPASPFDKIDQYLGQIISSFARTVSTNEGSRVAVPGAAAVQPSVSLGSGR